MTQSNLGWEGDGLSGFSVHDASKATTRALDPLTSHLAGESVRDIGEKRRAVLLLLQCYPSGMTDEALVRLYDSAGGVRQSPSGLRTRRSELVSDGLVVDSGRRQALSSGRMGIVWRAV